MTLPSLAEVAMRVVRRFALVALPLAPLLTLPPLTAGVYRAGP